jgi:hypothetical protein
LQRTHLRRRDLDWLPPSLKAVRWAVAGTIWTGMVGGVAALSVASGGHVNGGLIGGTAKGLVLGGLYGGDWVARTVLRRRLAKLAHGQVELSRLKQEPDGELVHVRGRVKARAELSGLLDEHAPTVYRRVQLALDQLEIVHESAVDFTLVDESGEIVLVQVEGARIVVPGPKLIKRLEQAQEERLLTLPLPKEAQRWLDRRAKRQRKGKSLPRMAAGEFLLRDGDEVEVVGYKSRVVDASVEARLERETPMRATLRSGRALPLILSPALHRQP